ncbi:MAG: hypothetical protein K0U52_09720 [Gammaproteobacteria bacterium]|jgi:hypothetical protein|nr:hypothetical protein [Gammaproteobacteria bacterium]
MNNIAVPLFTLGTFCVCWGHFEGSVFCAIGATMAIATSCGIVAGKEYIKRIKVSP